MATTGVVTSTGNLTGGAFGSQTFGPFSQTFTAGVGQEQSISLSSGANTVTVPTGTTWIAILGANAANPQPNPSFSGTLTVRGVAGDTGIGVSAKYPTTFAFDSTVAAPASFVINASSATTVTILFW